MDPTAAINISVLSDDPIFINRVKIFSQNSSINFVFINKLWTESRTDMFIIDANLLGNFLEKSINPFNTKFIVRGKQEDLKPAFDAGCEDFLKIPCDMDELEIRLSNIINSSSAKLKWKNLTLEQDIIASKKSSIPLSIEEQAIFRLLIQNRGEAVPREAFFYILPGKHKNNSRVVDMHISNLRKKIQMLREKEKSCCGEIKTVRSYGYIVY